MFEPFSDDLFKDLPISGTYFELSLNDKLGDLIIFNYGKLPYLRTRFSKIVVSNAAPSILSEEFYHFKQIPRISENIYTFIDATLQSFEDSFDRYGLSQSVVFLECGSIRRCLIKSGVAEDEAAILSMKFILQLTSKIKQRGWHFVLWRHPLRNSPWGMESFTFAIDDTSFSEYISLDHPKLQGRIHPDQGVYAFTKIVYEALWGEGRNYCLKDVDLQLSSSSFNSGPDSYIVLNFSTGEEKKFQKLQSKLGIILHSLKSKSFDDYVFFISRPDGRWSQEAITQLESFAQRFKVCYFDFGEVDGTFYSKASIILSICSGFVHIAHVFNPRTITLSLEGTENDVEGRNPWAPAQSVFITEEDASGSVKKLSEMLRDGLRECLKR